MTRLPLSQRRIRTRRAAIIAAIGAYHAMYFMIRWWMMCGAAMNHMIESRALCRKYLGDEDVVGETQRSSPIEVEGSHVGTDVPLSDGVMGNASSKRKRGKSIDFNQTFMDSCMVMKDALDTFGQSLIDSLKMMANERTACGDLMERVVKEMEDLSGITLDQRLKAMDVIGSSATRSQMFFSLDQAGKICMVQMIANGSIG